MAQRSVAEVLKANDLIIKCYNVVASVENLGQVPAAEKFCRLAIMAVSSREPVNFINHAMGTSYLFQAYRGATYGQDSNIHRSGHKPKAAPQKPTVSKIPAGAGYPSVELSGRNWSAGPNRRPVRGNSPEQGKPGEVCGRNTFRGRESW